MHWDHGSYLFEMFKEYLGHELYGVVGENRTRMFTEVAAPSLALGVPRHFLYAFIIICGMIEIFIISIVP